MTTEAVQPRQAPEGSRQTGRRARETVPLDEHASFRPAADRDPVGLLLEQARTRVPELVPIRHGRMLASPFSFFRGAALPMAADLAGTPTSGLRVQLCGDAHLSNFGMFGSPERRLVFDLNDFDESLPGPFEWDVKRLAASVAVAGRGNGSSRKECRAAVLRGARAYRTAMREFAEMPTLDVWYAHLDVETTLAQLRKQIPKRTVEAAETAVAKARTRDSMQALTKLTTVRNGRRQIVSQPPLIVPLAEALPTEQSEYVNAVLGRVVDGYRRKLPPDRRHLLGQFHIVDAARKVVGVGSVGIQEWILLMESTTGDPLVLQAKQAEQSVLARYAGRSRHRNQGERVVAGQRLMQATSDLFLGWQRVTGSDGAITDYYIRQLRDWKLSADIEAMARSALVNYARLCGWTLARAHARSGDRVAIAAYLGKSDRFENAVAEFADRYADQNDRDYTALRDAVASGRVAAQPDA
jgi:uncharacterized protein (DUF2252 family)